MKKEYTKKSLKEMIAGHQLDVILEDLLDLLSKYLKNNNDKPVEKIYDAVILVSGKYKSVIHENILGIIDPKEVALQKSQIGYSLISLVNDLPEKVLSYINTHTNDNDKIGEITVREQILKKEDRNYLYDAFLSFSSKDLAEARHFCEELRGQGLRIFMSSEVMKANIGNSFFEKIEYALERSQHFILLCTPNSMDSEWVKTEYETFYNEYFIKDKHKRKFLLMKGSKYKIDLVPSLFRRLQFAENTNEVIAVILGKEPHQIVNAKKRSLTCNLKVIIPILFSIVGVIYILNSNYSNSKSTDTKSQVSTSLMENARLQLKVDTFPTDQLVKTALSDFNLEKNSKHSVKEAVQMLMWKGVDSSTIATATFETHSEIWGKLPTKLEVCIWTKTYTPNCYGIRFQRADLRDEYFKGNQTYIELCY
ncbi:MAG TPA: hypothetical protein DCF44_02720 [Chitinophagaceae bacterium]|nr:hypothetical protein [Chitinophagaceae bacterium]